jgi:transposase
MYSVQLFLINDRLARKLSSPEEISVQAGVSLQAARIFFEQIQEEMARAALANQIRQLAKQIDPEPTTFKAPAFLKEPCSCCGQQKLFPIGHKYMCQACDTVYDRF